MERLYCACEFAADPERRGPGILTGTLLTYGETTGDGRNIVFEAGSLEWPDGGVVLNLQHDRAQPLMRVVPQVDGDRVTVAARLPDTQRGRDAATMVRDGTLTGLSVEAEAKLTAHPAGAAKRIKRAVLRAAGLVDDPAFPGSRVEVHASARPAGRRRVWL